VLYLSLKEACGSENLDVLKRLRPQQAWEHQKVDFTAQANFGESSKPGASPVRTALYEGVVQYDLFTVKSDLALNFPPKYDSSYILVISDWYLVDWFPILNNMEVREESQGQRGLGENRNLQHQQRQ
jgi:hypothetical protein